MDEQQQRMAEELLFSIKKKPSFAKMLYFGMLDGKDVLPYPQIPQGEQAQASAFLKSVDAFAQQQMDADAIDRQAKIPDSVIQGLAKLGVLGATIPKEYGGLGLSHITYCKAIERISETCGATAILINAHQSIGVRALLLFGTPEQRRRWLPDLASGKKLAAFSLTEPNAGSDASAVETRAVFDPQKNVYRINGKKQWTTNGSIAQVLTVMAQTEVNTPSGKQDKVTAFLVTPDMPGFQIKAHALEKVGIRGTQTANLEFHDMEVPAENVLGPIGSGLKVCLTVLDFGRTTFGAMCTGASKLHVQRAIQHACTRFQFKRPLASFGLVKKKIALMSALTYAMDATTYMTAGFIDSHIEDFMLEAAILKVFASESLWTINYETMQIFGGRSFFTDEPFERMMRDARLNMIGEGSNEVMRAFIGAVGLRDLGMQLKGIQDAFYNISSDYKKLWGFGKSNLYRLFAKPLQVKSPLLSKEAIWLGVAVRQFGIACVRALAAYREEILEKQMVLDRLASIAIALYTTTAVLSKIDSELERAGGDKSRLEHDLASAKLYCVHAKGIVDHALKTLFKNDDREMELTSDCLTGIKQKW